MVTPNKDNIFYSTLALFGVTVVVYFMKMLSGSRNHLIRMYSEYHKYVKFLIAECALNL
jgi:hypothetical protein